MKNLPFAPLFPSLKRRGNKYKASVRIKQLSRSLLRMKACGNDKGVALAAVLFLLTALGAISLATSVAVVNRQEQSVNALQGHRAYYAASSGIEWAKRRAAEMGWQGAELYNLAGEYTLPSSDSFTISYNAPELVSSSTVGGASRSLVYADFKGQF